MYIIIHRLLADIQYLGNLIDRLSFKSRQLDSSTLFLRKPF
nr:hypothetical protein [Muribaculum intestinale]